MALNSPVRSPILFMSVPMDALMSPTIWPRKASSCASSIEVCAMSYPRVRCCRTAPRHYARSVVLCKVALDDLARGVARQLVEERDLPGHLVPGQVGLDVVLELLLGRLLLALGRHDERLEALAELLVGDTHHRDLVDAGMFVQEVLDLAREDVLASRDDHLVVAAVDEQAAVGV